MSGSGSPTFGEAGPSRTWDPVIEAWVRSVLLLLGALVPLLAACGDDGGEATGPDMDPDPMVPDPPSNALVFAAAPSETEVRLVIEPAIEVTVQDTAGRTVSSSAPTISLTLGSNPGGAMLGGTTTVTAEEGVATFDDLWLDRRGAGFTLVASAEEDEDLEDGESEPFDVVFRFASVSAGSRHTCGVTENGIGYCWGADDSGQLGNENGGTGPRRARAGGRRPRVRSDPRRCGALLRHRGRSRLLLGRERGRPTG